MTKHTANMRGEAAQKVWGDFSTLPQKKVVVVWDLNHTLVPWYKMKRGGTPEERQLFDEWMALSESVQSNELRGTSASWQDAPNPLALGSTMLDKVSEVYNAPCSVPAAELASLENDTEKIALAYVEGMGGVNIVLTAAPLKGTVSKLIVFGMAKHVPLELVYSASSGKEEIGGGGKSAVATEAIEAGKKLIAAGRKGKVVVIGGKGKEEEEFASMNRAQFVKVSQAKDIHNIRQVLDSL